MLKPRSLPHDPEISSIKMRYGIGTQVGAWRACDALPGPALAGVLKFETSQLGYTMSYIDNSTQSPCKRNCCLDDDSVCLGCFRTLEEIKEWGVADSHRRRIILQDARQRRDTR
jgi:predicted Fe-S protein YdhL (DUF1289 family)